MIAIVAQVATLIVAVLGVLFGKQGRRSKLNVVGYVTLGLMLLAGAIGIVESLNSGEEKRQLYNQIAALNGTIRDLRNQTVMLAAKDIDEFTHMRVVFKRSHQFMGSGDNYKDIGGSIGPVPIRFAGVQSVKIGLGPQTIFDASIIFEFEKQERQLIAYEWIDDERKPFPIDCQTSETKCLPDSITPHWKTDALNGFISHVVFIPTKATGRRLLTAITDDPGFGVIDVTHAIGGFDAKAYVKALNENFDIILKVYGTRIGQDGRNCSAVITMQLQTLVLSEAAQSSRLGILPIGNLQFESCEYVPM